MNRPPVNPEAPAAPWRPLRRPGEGGNAAPESSVSSGRAYSGDKNPIRQPAPEDAQDGQDAQHGTTEGDGHLRENRYRGLPVMFLVRPDGTVEPCPFLMSVDDIAAFFRLADSRTRFPRKTIERYRRMGLRAVRVGRRKWFRLDDVLRFLDDQHERPQ